MSDLKRSCGRQTAESLRSGERSYDSYFPNDAKFTELPEPLLGEQFCHDSFEIVVIVQSNCF